MAGHVVKMFDVDDWQPEFAYMVIKLDGKVCDGKEGRPFIQKMLASTMPDTPIKSKAVVFFMDENGVAKHSGDTLETETVEGIIEWTLEGDKNATK